MKIAIHQPEFLPWLGFFHKLAQVDTFVLLDNVAFRYHYFQNRNRINSKNGMVWINVPVLTKGKSGQKINEVCINNDIDWGRKIAQSIKLNYCKSPFFQDYFHGLAEAFSREWVCLRDLNMELIRRMASLLGCGSVNFVNSSDIVSGDEKGVKLILDICAEMKADTLLLGISGIAGQGNASDPLFKERGIQIEYQEFYHPVYKQMHGEFIPFLSIVDLFFNHGSAALDIIQGKNVDRLNYLLE